MLISISTRVRFPLSGLRHEIVEQRAVVNELAEMLETAKRSLVACADRESELRSELARTRALAETFSWRVEDVDISNDALRAQREEAIEEWNEAEDRRAALEVRNGKKEKKQSLMHGP